MSEGSVQWRMRMRSSAWRPPTDLFETEESIVVRVEIAGMDEDDFNIELTDHILSIHGYRQDVQEERAYHQAEIRFGEFNIEIHLPVPVETRAVEAKYKNGFLRVTLPKARSAQIRVED